MKKILVLIDFSKRELGILESAAMFAIKLKADLMLFHLHRVKNPDVFAAGNGVTENIKVALTSDKQPNYRPSVEVKYCDGEIEDQLASMAARTHIDMIIIGAGTIINLKKILLLCRLDKMVGLSDCAVLVIPKGKVVKKIERVIFATNFTESDIYAVEYLLNFARVLEFRLEILHMNLRSDNASNIEKDALNLLFRCSAGKCLLSSYQPQSGYTQADILSFTYDQPSCFMKFFKEGFRNLGFGRCEVPFLIFPSKIKRRFSRRFHENSKSSSFSENCYGNYAH